MIYFLYFYIIIIINIINNYVKDNIEKVIL